MYLSVQFVYVGVCALISAFRFHSADLLMISMQPTPTLMGMRPRRRLPTLSQHFSVVPLLQLGGLFRFSRGVAEANKAKVRAARMFEASMLIVADEIGGLMLKSWLEAQVNRRIDCKCDLWAWTSG
jgi:hypothetical protein